eukprot:3167972-Pleurochrysis_carterae.AAC.1
MFNIPLVVTASASVPRLRARQRAQPGADNATRHSDPIERTRKHCAQHQGDRCEANQLILSELSRAQSRPVGWLLHEVGVEVLRFTSQVSKFVSSVCANCTRRFSPTWNSAHMKLEDRVQQLLEALRTDATHLVELLALWDEDNDGNVSRQEFRNVLPVLGLIADRTLGDALFDKLLRLVRRSNRSKEKRTSMDHWELFRALLSGKRFAQFANLQCCTD